MGDQPGVGVKVRDPAAIGLGVSPVVDQPAGVVSVGIGLGVSPVGVGVLPVGIGTGRPVVIMLKVEKVAWRFTLFAIVSALTVDSTAARDVPVASAFALA